MLIYVYNSTGGSGSSTGSNTLGSANVVTADNGPITNAVFFSADLLLPPAPAGVPGWYSVNLPPTAPSLVQQVGTTRCTPIRTDIVRWRSACSVLEVNDLQGRFAPATSVIGHGLFYEAVKSWAPSARSNASSSP